MLQQDEPTPSSFHNTLFMHIVANISIYPMNHLPNPYGRETADQSGIYIPTANKKWFARDILAKITLGCIEITYIISLKVLDISLNLVNLSFLPKRRKRMEINGATEWV